MCRLARHRDRGAGFRRAVPHFGLCVRHGGRGRRRPCATASTKAAARRRVSIISATMCPSSSSSSKARARRSRRAFRARGCVRCLPPGGARNAVDCALWELESARAGRPVWELAGLAPPKPVVTTFTVGADGPEAMAEKARSYRDAKAIKVKLTGELELDIERVRAVRAARPDVWLGVDGNQGFERGDLEALISDARAGACVAARAAAQARQRGRARRSLLVRSRSPATRACCRSPTCRRGPGRFDVVNIKLDKCGGLTEGLADGRRGAPARASA